MCGLIDNYDLAVMDNFPVSRRYDLPKIAANYAVVDKGLVAYVGSTDNLWERWKNHGILKSLTKNATIYWQPDQYCCSLKNVESMWIQCLRPTLNVQRPKLEEVEFNGGSVYFALTRLLSLPLSKNQLRVAFWLPMISERGNIVSVSGAQAEASLGIERHLFSRIMSRLVKEGYLRRRGWGIWKLNPHYGWNGSAAEHGIAIEEWDAEEKLAKNQKKARTVAGPKLVKVRKTA